MSSPFIAGSYRVPDRTLHAKEPKANVARTLSNSAFFEGPHYLANLGWSSALLFEIRIVIRRLIIEVNVGPPTYL
jgi:hypothetical protein